MSKSLAWDNIMKNPDSADYIYEGFVRKTLTGMKKKRWTQGGSMRIRKNPARSIGTIALAFLLIIGSLYIPGGQVGAAGTTTYNNYTKVLDYVLRLKDGKLVKGSPVAIDINKLKGEISAEFNGHLMSETSFFCEYYAGGKAIGKGTLSSANNYSTYPMQSASEVRVVISCVKGSYTSNFWSPYIQFIDEPTDAGTYFVDLSQGNNSISADDFDPVYTNISANKELKRINVASSGGKYILDINKSGKYDVALEYSTSNGVTTGNFTRFNTCDVGGTVEIYCSASEAGQYLASGSTGSFYSTVIFMLPDLAPQQNPAAGGGAYTPAQVNAEGIVVNGEVIDYSMKVPSIKNPVKGDKAITASWKKWNKKALKTINGFEIQYSTDKDFKVNTKKVSVNKKKTSKEIKKLTPGKKYYVHARAYRKTVSGKVYSGWSKTKSIKVVKTR